MEYVGVKFNLIDKGEVSDIIIALLDNLGYDMFEENENELNAFIPSIKFDLKQIQKLIIETEVLNSVSFSTEILKHKNWNAVWESNYDPILIADKVYIRAPFHSPNNATDFELVIQPKMSFGTGHHDTTKLMIEFLLKLKLKNKQVLDMGTGTGGIGNIG